MPKIIFFFLWPFHIRTTYRSVGRKLRRDKLDPSRVKYTCWRFHWKSDEWLQIYFAIKSGKMQNSDIFLNCLINISNLTVFLWRPTNPDLIEQNSFRKNFLRTIQCRCILTANDSGLIWKWFFCNVVIKFIRGYFVNTGIFDHINQMKATINYFGVVIFSKWGL